MTAVAADVLILSESNSETFLGSRQCKALLFTKKSETPVLWLRLAETFKASYVFGEVRHTEEKLLQQFNVSAETLPRIVAIREVGCLSQTVHYDGPTNFEKISDFLRDILDGGPAVVELRKQALTNLRIFFTIYELFGS